MNGIAIEALIKLDRQRDSDRHAELVLETGERIRSLQAGEGLSKGGLPYSDLEPDLHIPLYTALTLRGLCVLAKTSGDTIWEPVVRDATAFLNRMEDPETGLWYHNLRGGQVHRFPIFVAGAGMICNSLLDAGSLVAGQVDVRGLAARLLRFQYRHGPIRNFIGYDHPENGRRRGRGGDCWEDVYPTPSWNAQAFHFLCRVLPPPEPPLDTRGGSALIRSRRYAYGETRTFSAIAGFRPLGRGVLALFVKRRRHGLVIPGPHMILRQALNQITRLRRG